MPSDFFEVISPNLQKLNTNEQKLLDYVIKNTREVKGMSIRTLSHTCYVSTTTTFRFVRKLGFEGYADFLNALRLTDSSVGTAQIPDVVRRQDYLSSYIKNTEETLRVFPEEKLKQFFSYLGQKPRIYLLASGLSGQVATYVQYLYTVLGFDITFLSQPHQIKTAVEHIREEDLLWALSFSGQNEAVVEAIERIFVKKRPALVSITCSNNNLIQNLSDLNFYLFADAITYHGVDITSRMNMVAIAEILAYAWIAHAEQES